jgi:protein involved in polysaccharide export with SLBB domain
MMSIAGRRQWRRKLMGRVPETASRNLCILMLGGLAICALPGCGSGYQGQRDLPPESSGPPRVTLSAGDVVDVRFFYTPELNVTQAVRPDGKISLQLIGEVSVEGKSPAELREELLAIYQSHLKEPDVAVIVQSFYRRRIFVGGEVVKPGVVSMPGRMTALDAIMEAGGFRLPTAEVGSVVVVRRQDSVQSGYCIDLKPALKGGEIRPFFLEPEDIVYVPQTRITEVGQWIDQHINNLIPKTGLVVLTQSGDTTVGYDLR